MNEPETEILTRLTAIETKLDAVISKDTDHEARIRRLEEKRTVSPGQLWAMACSLVGLLVGATVISRFVLEIVVK